MGDNVDVARALACARAHSTSIIFYYFNAKDDIDLRTWIRNKEARQLLFRKGRFQEI